MGTTRAALSRKLAAAEAELERQRAVIRAFYVALNCLGVCPDGFYQWTKRDARQFAAEIVKKARGQ